MATRRSSEKEPTPKKTQPKKTEKPQRKASSNAPPSVSVRLKSRVSTGTPLLWSPRGDRVVTRLDFALTMLAADAKGRLTPNPVALEGSAGAYAWNADGSLAVVELLDGDDGTEKARLVVLAADGQELSSFALGSMKSEYGQMDVRLSVLDDGRLVVYDEKNGTRVYTSDGAQAQTSTKKWTSYSPSGQLSIDEDGKIVDETGKVRFTVESRFCWLTGNEVLVFQDKPTAGVYRVVVEPRGTPEAKLVFACDTPVRMVLGPRGESVGLSYRDGRLDVYALPTGERTRQLHFPDADNSGLIFAFAPDDRLMVGVEWKKDLLVFPPP